MCCECGTYDCAVIVICGEYRFDADKCLRTEILKLWQEGVKTVASCCGHRQVLPIISVQDESVPLMEAMGYRHRYVNTNPSLNHFTAKTIIS